MKIPSFTLVVTPDEGTGKSQLGKFIVGLYGVHGKIITDREMESSFDDWKAAESLRSRRRSVFQGETVRCQPPESARLNGG